MNITDCLGQPITIGDVLCHTQSNGSGLMHKLVEVVGFTPKGRLKVRNIKQPSSNEPSITHSNVVVVTRQFNKKGTVH